MAEEIKNKSQLDEKFPIKDASLNYQYYLANRENFETGDLLFFSGNHWLSSLIRWRSKAAWSHLGMVVKLKEIDRLFLAESVIENGVRLLPLSFIFNNYNGKNEAYNGRVAWAKHENLQMDVQTQDLLKTFCFDNLTKQYDRREYYRILYRSVVGKEKLFVDDKYTCAEYIYEAYKYAKILKPRDNGLFISPGAFWRQHAVIMKSMLI